MKKDVSNVNRITMTALMTALVFVGSMIQIRLGFMRFHLGNGFGLLAGFLLAPLTGGLASGAGSLLYDLFFYPSSPVGFLVTFGSKFMMGCVAGLCFRGLKRRNETLRIVIGGVVGEAAYIVCYMLKTFVVQRYVAGNPMNAVAAVMAEKLTASVVNAMIAVLLAVLFYSALVPVLKKTGAFSHLK